MFSVTGDHEAVLPSVHAAPAGAASCALVIVNVQLPSVRLSVLPSESLKL